MNKLICGDCLKVLPTLPKATMVWADPPDNLGMKYKGFIDKQPNYIFWLQRVLYVAAATCPGIFWLSYNNKYQPAIMTALGSYDPAPLWRQFIWHYTFGQNRKTDFVSSYRPILRIMKPNVKTYPKAVRIPSLRQIKYNDKRAKSGGKTPDDVWEFPRVCGTFHERKKWIPNQHPKDLLRRMVLFSTKPGDLVIDMFAGSGNMFEVCHELKRDCIGIEISSEYCKYIRKNLRKLK